MLDASASIHEFEVQRLAGVALFPFVGKPLAEVPVAEHSRTSLLGNGEGIADMIHMAVGDDDIGHARQRGCLLLCDSALALAFEDGVPRKKRVNQHLASRAFEAKGRMSVPRDFHGNTLRALQAVLLS